MRRIALVVALVFSLAFILTGALPGVTASSPEYSIQAIRYADLPAQLVGEGGFVT